MHGSPEESLWRLGQSSLLALEVRTKLLMKADADVKGRTLLEESQDGEVPEAEDEKEAGKAMINLRLQLRRRSQEGEQGRIHLLRLQIMMTT